jgi:hypothetical protein
MEIQTNDNKEIITRESVKLEKNSKGFNWELRINAKEIVNPVTLEKEAILDTIDIQRLQQLNDEMAIRFGSKDERV